MPAVVELTVSVAVPEPGTLVGLIVAVSPEDGVTVSETVLENPLNAVTVIVEVPEVAVEIAIVDGFAVNEKSGPVGGVTVTEVMAELTSLPLK